MQLEVGRIVEGKVTGITNFGAFIELESGKTGLVHISEVSNKFVKEIRDYIKEGDLVKVKIMNILSNGKIELSMKQTETLAKPVEKKVYFEKKSRNSEQISNKFEDMITKFKKLSDEKLSDFKKKTESRRGKGHHKSV